MTKFLAIFSLVIIVLLAFAACGDVLPGSKPDQIVSRREASKRIGEEHH